MATFEPPTTNDVPPVGAKNETDPAAYALFRHYSPRPRGRAVLRIDGTYQTIDVPTGDQIDSATEVYLGGHVYTVDAAVAARLQAAGYTVT